MSVSKRLRYEILRRDNYTCRYCGASAPDVALTVDHVLPVALGGSDEPTNLVAACRDCNAGKSSSNPDQPLIDDVSEDAIRWSRAIRLAGERVALDVHSTEKYTRDVVEAWGKYDEKLASLPGDIDSMCGHWRAAGLPSSVVVNAVDIAWTNARVPRNALWRYVIGIMKNRVSDAEKHARDIIEGGDA